MIKMCVYEQVLIYMIVELYKNNDTGLTKQNVLELSDKNENKHKGFFYFCITLLPVCIAYVCDILYMCYINKYLKYIYILVKKI